MLSLRGTLTDKSAEDRRTVETMREDRLDRDIIARERLRADVQERLRAPSSRGYSTLGVMREGCPGRIEQTLVSLKRMHMVAETDWDS